MEDKLLSQQQIRLEVDLCTRYKKKGDLRAQGCGRKLNLEPSCVIYEHEEGSVSGRNCRHEIDKHQKWEDTTANNPASSV